MPTIQIIAFRGTGGFDNPKYKQFPGLIKAGHVGIKFEDDKRIFGFHPSPKAEMEAGSEEKLLELLLQGIAQEGTLQVDTDIFVLAYQLHQQGERTEVWVIDQEYTEAQYNQIKENALKWHTDGAVWQYSLPNRDGTFDENEYNCAIFPKLLGIRLPIDDGKIAKYLYAMKQSGSARKWYPSQENS